VNRTAAPDERAFAADIAKPLFFVGVVDERWRLIHLAWPLAVIAVKAKDGAEYAFRFDCTGYPVAPPTARLWSVEKDAPLAFDLWPRSAVGGRLGAVMRRDWKEGTALYLPCDREAIAGHDGWQTEQPSKLWQPSTGIVHYLELIHELLHCRDYAAPTRAAS